MNNSSPFRFLLCLTQCKTTSIYPDTKNILISHSGLVIESLLRSKFTCMYTNTRIYVHTHTYTHTHTRSGCSCHRDIETSRHRDIETSRHRDIETSRHRDIETHTYDPSPLAYIQTHAYIHTYTHTHSGCSYHRVTSAF
jgi:hypothetical protein